ncbi:MAG TPA: hypothetical protein VF214_01780 [Edaphobacter sp.]
MAKTKKSAATPKAATAPADTPAPVSPVLTNPTSVETYQALYDALSRAYWEASDIVSKDTIHGAQEAVYDIITQLDEAQLEANTAKFLALVPAIKNTNAALQKIQNSIDQITKNISTAATVIAAINKVLSLTSAL